MESNKPHADKMRAENISAAAAERKEKNKIMEKCLNKEGKKGEESYNEKNVALFLYVTSRIFVDSYQGYRATDASTFRTEISQ